MRRIATFIFVSALFFLGASAFSEVFNKEQYMYKKAVAENPDNPQAYLKLGKSYLSTGDYKKAINHLITAAKLQPSGTEVYYSLAKAYGASENYKAKIEVLKKIATIEPNSATAYVRLGMANSIVKKHKQASEFYEQALMLNPQYPNLRYLMAVSYYGSNQYDESMFLLKEEIRQNGISSEAHHILGLMYLKQGVYNKAITHLQKALTINPNLLKQDLFKKSKI